MSKIVKLSEAINAFGEYSLLKSTQSIDCEEYRKRKKDLIKATPEFVNESAAGRYYRDEDCIVISAPKIIIGNVDKHGNLLGDGQVVIRSKDISIEGSGDTQNLGGSIVCRAASIRQEAVDSGTDGQESVVCKNRSEIVSQANNVMIYGSNDYFGTFATTPSGSKRVKVDDEKKGRTVMPAGVTVHSDASLAIEAMIGYQTLKAEMTAAVESFKDSIAKLKDRQKEVQDNLKILMNHVTAILEEDEKLDKSSVGLSKSTVESDALSFKFDMISPMLTRTLQQFLETTSCLGLYQLKTEQFENAIKSLPKNEEQFSSESNGTSISVYSEAIKLESRDGDGNVRQTPESGITLNSANNFITSSVGINENIIGGTTFVNSRHILLTSSQRFYQNDKDGNLLYDGNALEGSVTINTKDLNLNGELTKTDGKGKIVERGLDKSSVLTTNFYTTNIMSNSPGATDGDNKLTQAEKGKSCGNVVVDAKNIIVGGYDKDKRNKREKLAELSTLNLNSQIVEIGGTPSSALNGKPADKHMFADIIGMYSTQLTSLQVNGNNPGKFEDSSSVRIFKEATEVSSPNKKNRFYIDDDTASMRSGSNAVVTDSSSVAVSADLIVDKELKVKKNILTAADVVCKELKSAVQTSINEEGQKKAKETDDAIKKLQKQNEDLTKQFDETMKKIAEEKQNVFETFKKQLISKHKEALKAHQDALKNCTENESKVYYESRRDEYQKKIDYLESLTEMPDVSEIQPEAQNILTSSSLVFNI